VTATLPTAACPDCVQPTVTTGLGRPWCPACDWNLDTAAPAVFGWGWLDRRLHRVSVRLTAAQFTALAGGPLTPGTMTVARLTTVAAAVVLLAGVLAIAVLGVWLLVFDFFSLSTVLGALLLGVAFLLRPRLGRLSALTDDGARLDPAQAR
jgi:heat shock protein HtpX